LLPLVTRHGEFTLALMAFVSVGAPVIPHQNWRKYMPLKTISPSEPTTMSPVLFIGTPSMW
jgi:hypothetical protein